MTGDGEGDAVFKVVNFSKEEEASGLEGLVIESPGRFDDGIEELNGLFEAALDDEDLLNEVKAGSEQAIV